MNIYCFSTLSFAKLQFKSVINKAFHKHGVASFTDAWIETSDAFCCLHPVASHLLQMRGLKLIINHPLRPNPQSHLLQMRGLKLHPYKMEHVHGVASFTDAWIETRKILHFQPLV